MLIAFVIIFLFGFSFFCLSISSYIPVFFGEKIQSTVVGVDSIYHMPKSSYMYDYFPVYEYSKKNIEIKNTIPYYNAKKENIEKEIGKKKIIYYKKGYEIVDTNSESMFLTNIFIIVSFFIWTPIALFFYTYFKKKYGL